MIVLDTHVWVWFVDPADRIIIATAITIAASVVTKDEKILNYPHVKSIW
jgi:PIN domain nuclease of toxin-antitoxin system